MYADTAPAAGLSIGTAGLLGRSREREERRRADGCCAVAAARDWQLKTAGWRHRG